MNFIELYKTGTEDTNKLDRYFGDDLSNVTNDEYEKFINEFCDDYEKCYEFLKAIEKIRSKNNE